MCSITVAIRIPHYWASCHSKKQPCGIKSPEPSRCRENYQQSISDPRDLSGSEERVMYQAPNLHCIFHKKQIILSGDRMLLQHHAAWHWFTSRNRCLFKNGWRSSGEKMWNFTFLEWMTCAGWRIITPCKRRDSLWDKAHHLMIF